MYLKHGRYCVDFGCRDGFSLYQGLIGRRRIKMNEDLFALHSYQAKSNSSCIFLCSLSLKNNVNVSNRGSLLRLCRYDATGIRVDEFCDTVSCKTANIAASNGGSIEALKNVGRFSGGTVYSETKSQFQEVHLDVGDITCRIAQRDSVSTAPCHCR